MITIVNADKRQVQVRVFNGQDTVCLTDINNYALNGGDHRVVGTPPDGSHCYRVAASYYWDHASFIRQATSGLDHTNLTGQLPKGHIICLFDFTRPYTDKNEPVPGGIRGDIPYIADYSELLDGLRNKLKDYGNDADELKIVLNSVEGVLPALATSLAALGPAGAIPAGVFTAIAGLISILFYEVGEGTVAKVTPPTLKEIELTVEHVVDEANYRTDARDATVCIKNATNWLTSRADHFMSDTSRHDSNAEEKNLHFIKDFRSDLETLVGQGSELRSSMVKLKEYPNIAKYMLPVYVVGAWTWLTILRLHDAVRLIDGDKIDLYDVSQYDEQLSSLIDGLIKAKLALQEFCDAKVRKDNVAPDSIFGQILSATHMSKYTGVDTTSQYQTNYLPKVGTELGDNPFLFLDSFVGILRQHRTYIKRDISRMSSDPNAEPKEYLNPDWYQKARSSTDTVDLTGRGVQPA